MNLYITKIFLQCEITFETIKNYILKHLYVHLFGQSRHIRCVLLVNCKHKEATYLLQVKFSSFKRLLCQLHLFFEKVPKLCQRVSMHYSQFVCNITIIYRKQISFVLLNCVKRKMHIIICISKSNVLLPSVIKAHMVYQNQVTGVLNSYISTICHKSI